MISLEKFNKRMNLCGGSLRNENIQNNKRMLEATFKDDASFATGIFVWDLETKSYNEKEPLDIRIYHRTFSNANGATAQFQTLMDVPVYVGDILYDSEMEEHWICTESFNIDNIHWQGKLTLCNWILKWQNKYGEILEYPCHDINSTQYNSGEQPNKLFAIGTAQHMITLPADKNTVLISSPQRFFLDKNPISPTPYVVTQNDTTSYAYGKKGLVKVTLMQTVINSETDRIDLGICDYIYPKDVKTNNADKKYVAKSVISFDSKIIKSGGDLQVFDATFYDKYGKEITGIIPKWEIVCDFQDDLIVQEVDNQIKIGIDNDNYIDEEFKLVLTDLDGNYSSNLIIRIESLI